MKTEVEKPLLENYPAITILNNHRIVVVEEQLSEGYFLRKVAEYFYSANIYKLFIMLIDTI